MRALLLHASGRVPALAGGVIVESPGSRARARRPPRGRCQRRSRARLEHHRRVRRLVLQQGRQPEPPDRLLQSQHEAGARHSGRPEQPHRAGRSRSRPADALPRRPAVRRLRHQGAEGFRRRRSCPGPWSRTGRPTPLRCTRDPTGSSSRSEDPANKNTPPVLRFEPSGKAFTGPPSAVAATFTARAGHAAAVGSMGDRRGAEVNVPDAPQRTGGWRRAPPAPPRLALTWSLFRGREKSRSTTQSRRPTARRRQGDEHAPPSKRRASTSCGCRRTIDRRRRRRVPVLLDERPCGVTVKPPTTAP